ncbi:gluconokinase [Arthrobacter zhangbolii]|uniref:Gluconokinase n=1 Tax=Arthrobacter zhangbolii TaxID=2886936 RepID=A0A9X1MAP2_9MICC|nr:MULTISPECIES: gluconokinase [Arthrobacter]MCC3273349.1 gluconokinase [Arthrobacter zhangbolii]MCC3295971.1 gluconokinase [Arthrobacter zhangbolii]MDN3905630.1 gluconokinase [Arthrobacter sp. YD2]UON92672.1 gluconokinase [Arthrobacter zhangbolii]
MSSANPGVPPLIVMGVQGCGKSTSGRAIAEALSLPFIDGDDLHPLSNKAKMASGHPLTDADREPWLAAIGTALAEGLSRGQSTVIACSALKRRYRDLIRSFAPRTRFVHLAGNRGLIAERLSHRNHEYMPPALLDSQFETLEPLEADEAGIPVDINLTPEEIAAVVATALTSR